MNLEHTFTSNDCHFILFTLVYLSDVSCVILPKPVDKLPQLMRLFAILIFASLHSSPLHLSEIIMSFSSLLFSLKSYCLELEKHLSCASLYSVQWTRNSFFRFLLSLITKSLGLPVGLVSQFLFPVCDH